MKKITYILGASILLLSSLAFAAEDWTFICSVKANGSETKSYTMSKGQDTIEISSGNDNLTCQFIIDNNIVAEKKNSNHCLVRSIDLDGIKINIKVVNPNNKNIDYKIWIH